MKALVTGGGGFLGGRIVTMLQQRGTEVLALGRRSYPQLERQGIATVQADLCDAQAIGNACRGMDVVFHVAALTDLWGNRRRIWDTNVTGTRHVLEACRQQGVGRLVYTSTPSVVFGRAELRGVDESQPYPERFLAHYPESKAVAEQMVLQADCADLHTVALRPHLIYGPGDPHLIPRIMERARKRQLIQVGDGSNLVDITYIDDAAEAHLLAADALASGAPCRGRAYFISQGEPVELWPWLNDLLARLGLPRVSRSISYRSAWMAGAVSEWVHALLRLDREPRMTRFLASQLACSHYFDISAATREIGYVPRISSAEGVERLVASLQS